MAFGFKASSPPDNITLNAASMKTDESLSNFQTGFGAAVHATLETEQLISLTRAVLVDTLASVQDSKGELIPVSGVHELLTKIHDNLDSALSQWIGNTAHILAHLFDYISRQHHRS